MEAEIFQYICANKGAVDAEELMCNLFPGGSVNEVITNQEKFVLFHVNTEQKVVARTGLRLCKKKDCPGVTPTGPCGELHLCKNFLFSGVCHYMLKRGVCSFSNDLTSDHNQRVLKEHGLEGLSRVELRTLLLQNDFALLPSICHDYNNGDGVLGRCQNAFACERLHICEKYPRQSCTCDRNHNFYAPQPLKALSKKGIPNALFDSLRSTYANKEALRVSGDRGARRRRGNRNSAANNVDAKSDDGLNLEQRQWHRGRGGNRGQRGNRGNGGNGRKTLQQQRRSSVSDILSSIKALDLYTEDGLNEGDGWQRELHSPNSDASADAKSDSGLNLEQRQWMGGRGRGGNSNRGGSRANTPQQQPTSAPKDGCSNFDVFGLYSNSKLKEGVSQQPDANSSNSDISSVGNDADTSVNSGQGKQQAKNPNLTSAARGIGGKQKNQQWLPAITAIGSENASSGSEPSKKQRQKYVKDKTEICMFFIKGNCRNEDRCFKLHDKMPYRWQVQEGGQWTDLPDNETIEKDYCDPQNTYSSSSPSVHFDTMTCGANKVRRLSTLNSVVEPEFIHTTEWLWYWQDESGVWKQYGSDSGRHGSADINSTKLEQKLQDNSKDVVEFTAGSQSYSLCLQDMIQTNKHYGTKRPVIRRPRFVSAEEVKTKKVRRSPYSAPVPDTWDKTQIPQTGFSRVNLQRSSEDFQKVQALFCSTMRGFDIIKVERIQNRALWEVFQWQKNQMRNNNGGRYVTEKQLFHGTDSKHVVAICNNNFDWRICGTHGTAYGKGSYFARDANYSHSYTGDSNVKTLFISRVLVGSYTKGESKYVRPPSKDGGDTNFYDSCVNNVIDPSIFVVFEKHQIYPEFLLQYKTTDLLEDSDGSDVQSPILKPVPAAKPAVALSRSTTVTHQPKLSTLHQPSTPLYRPSTSAYQSSTSAYQPSTSAYQSSTSAYQPSTSAYQSSTSAYQSSTSAYQPSASAYRSSTSAYQPSASAYKSSTSYIQPSTSAGTYSLSYNSSTASSQYKTTQSPSSSLPAKATPKKSDCVIA